MTVIKPPDEPHHCSPEPGVIILPYHHGRMAAYNEGGVYLVDYPAGTSLICDECGKVWTANGWEQFASNSAIVHRETASERKLREHRT